MSSTREQGVQTEQGVQVGVRLYVALLLIAAETKQAVATQHKTVVL